MAEEDFSLPQQGSDRYKELSGGMEESWQERISAAFSNAVETLKEKPIIIAVILIILIAAAWFFLLRAQEATLVLEVSELDAPGSAVVGATVSFLAEDGRSIRDDALTDDIGNLKTSAPAEREFSLKIVPLSQDLKTYERKITLKAGSTSTIEAKLEKRNSLSLQQNAYELTLAPGCSRTLEMGVDNFGNAAFETQVVVDDALQKFVKGGGAANIPAGGSETLSAAVSMASDADDKTSGKLRLKYTNREASFTLIRTDRKPRLDVTFDKSEVKEFKVSAIELPAIKKTQVKVRNTGASNSIPISDIDVSVIGDFAPWTQLDLATVEEINEKGGIPPGGEVLFGISVTVPQGTAIGPYAGQLIVKTSCDTKPLPLSATVEE